MHKLFLFFKMENGLTPQYLSDLFPARVGDVSAYNFRTSENYVLIHSHTRSYAESFLSSTIRAWNNLPESFKSASTLSEFKRMLTKEISKIPEYYYAGDRFSQILHTLLRLEYSSLNQLLFRRGLVPSPNCMCGDIESNEHFLMICPRYYQIRGIMPATPITAQLLLYGDCELSVGNNISLLKEVQKFIIKSKRFVS